MAPPLTDYI